MSGKALYYGWWNVLCAFVGFALSHATIAVFSFGTFVAPLQAEFGWNRGEIAFALTVNNLTVMLVAPLLGVLIDRFGVRRILLPSLGLMSCAVGGMTLLTGNLFQFYAMYSLIPLLGMATLPHGYSRVIITWFQARRGLALGVALSGIGMGAAIMPVFIQALIESFGWRFAYGSFAVLVVTVSLPLSYFFLREKPSSTEGLAETRSTVNGPASRIQAGAETTAGVTLSAAAATPSFWLIFASILLAGGVMGSMFVHLVPLLMDSGLKPVEAAYGASLLGAALIVGRIASGYLMDRYFAPYVAACSLLGMAVGVTLLALDASHATLYLAAILVGLASGSEMSEIAYIISRYFGNRAFGRIYGVMLSAFQLGGAIGAPVLGIYQHRTGGYTGMLWALGAASVVAAVLMASLRRSQEFSVKNHELA